MLYGISPSPAVMGSINKTIQLSNREWYVIILGVSDAFFTRIHPSEQRSVEESWKKAPLT